MAENNGETVAQIVGRYDGDAGMLIPMMQDIQAEFGYLPQPQLKELSSRLSVSLSRIYSVATFYSSFRLMPKGDHTIQLCMGTVCFLKGADKISDAIQQEFELVPGGTSPDGRKVARIASEFKARWELVAFSRDNAYFLARGAVRVHELGQAR